MAETPTSLSTFDLADIRGHPTSDIISALRTTLHGQGFFYLTGHGLDPQLIADALDAARRFFTLPMEDKLAIAMVKSPHFRGYNRAGQERTRGAPDWREQLDINTESAPLALTRETPPWRRLQGPNQWPDAMPELRPLLLAYQSAATRVGIEVLKAISTALGQRDDIFSSIYEPLPSQLLKIIRYPGLHPTETRQGVGAHKDNGFVTVLLQDRTPGLRVRTEQGVWVPVPPRPDAVVINTGELLELATDGFVRAAVHDVVAPAIGTDRLSVAFFLGARPDATVPLIELPNEIKPAQRGLSVDPLNPMFRNVGMNQLKSRLRSHPDVARAHHPDLI